MTLPNSPLFKINDEVYNVAPGSDRAIVIEIRYFFSQDRFEYLVTTGFGGYFWCSDEELSYEKTIE